MISPSMASRAWAFSIYFCVYMYMYFTFILERLNSNFLCNFLNSFARKAAAVQVRSMAPHGGNILGCLLFIFCECSNLCLYFRLHLKVNLFDFPTVSPAAVLQQAASSSRPRRQAESAFSTFSTSSCRPI